MPGALAIFLVLTQIPAFAEYRAFTIEILNEQNEVKRSFTTSLDPEQYVGYFPIEKNERIRYVETWMCRGSTARTFKVCANPKAISLQTTPPAQSPGAPAEPSKLPDQKEGQISTPAGT